MQHPYVAALTRADVQLPAAFADVDVVTANLARALDYAGGTPLRLATKSLRCPTLIERALDTAGVLGLMCAAADEAAWWARRRPGTDLLIAYPSTEPEALRRCAQQVAAGATIRFMVDCPAHLRLLDAVARAEGTTLDVCIDLDLSVDLGGRRGVRFGVYRSPVRTARHAVDLAREARRLGTIRVVGLMGYEAQVAGLQDRPALGPAARAAIIRRLKAVTAGTVRRRRAGVVRALRAAGVQLTFVNGGGTGSIPVTAGENAVTEIAVGSGLLCPTLFDGYDDVRFQPAAGFALRVTRIPTPGVVTCYGGGWVASGPAGADRLPRPWVPSGAALLPAEGSGEVQTPVRLPDGVTLEVGDMVLFRHAKAGELCDRTDVLHLISGSETVNPVATYRGDGLLLG